MMTRMKVIIIPSCMFIILLCILVDGRSMYQHQHQQPSLVFLGIRSKYGFNKHVEYVPGTAPIVISVPHGGDKVPANIPDRTHGSMVTDSRTIELGRAIRLKYHALTGHYPHLIISHLKRSKMDPNRPIRRATSGHIHAKRAYGDYHRFIASAKRKVVSSHKKGIYIDLHGQNHPKKWVELGYRISKAALNGGESRAYTARKRSSVNHLLNTSLKGVKKHKRARAMWRVLNGPKSLGALIQKQGHRTVPSPAHRKPKGAAYFCGGYSIARHGSNFKDPSPVDAIQVEVPRHLRIKAEPRRAFASHFAKALKKFHSIHYKSS